MSESLLDLYNNESYNSCLLHSKIWEESIGIYYTGILCCKDVSSIGKNSKKCIDTAFNKIKKWVTNDIKEVYNHIPDDMCVLIKGHTGKCHNTVNIFQGLPDTTIEKIKTSIYSTPGNDYYIFKNRSNRSFPIMLTDTFQRKIKNKNVKLSCAIPLKDASTPLMQASAYFDYITFIMNIREVREKYLNQNHKEYIKLLDLHKIELIKRFKLKNKKIFNNYGFTVCPVTGYEITINDVSRDTRIENSKTDIQLGHCEDRNEKSFTIRGFNFCLMTREGNRLVGDSSFFDDSWIEALRTALNFHEI